MTMREVEAPLDESLGKKTHLSETSLANDFEVVKIGGFDPVDENTELLE